MQIKIIGAGKCGARLTYDLFAFSRGLRSAYEIQIHQRRSSLSKALHEAKWVMATIANQIRTEFGNNAMMMADEPDYIIIDSDEANNEIMSGEIRYFTRDDPPNGGPNPQRSIMFRAQKYPLGQATGGCEFHAISEDIALAWQDMPTAITDVGDAGIIICAFSIGGGTGGGSSAVLIRQCIQRYPKHKNNPRHFMGLGVMPDTRTDYTTNLIGDGADTGDWFNFGRFMTSFLGRRPIGTYSATMDFGSLILVSNDILQLPENISRATVERDDGKREPNLSVINTYVAHALTVLSNSSSASAHAAANFDPREMGSKLASCPIVIGFGQRKVDETHSSEIQSIFSVKDLIRKALSNARYHDGAMFGLSVPIPQPDLTSLFSGINNEKNTETDFSDQMKNITAANIPLEFKTVQRFVVIHGLPQNRKNELKSRKIRDYLFHIFPSANAHFYNVLHEGETESLLVFLVDPFIRHVAKGVIYYAANAFAEDVSQINENAETFAAFIRGQMQDWGKIDSAITEKEVISELIYGRSKSDVESRILNTPELQVGKLHVRRAIEHLRVAYDRQKRVPYTSPDF